MSMSITVLKAFADRPDMGEMKFPAAPALLGHCQLHAIVSRGGALSYMTKSMPPNSSTHLATAPSRSCIFLTSTAPIPTTLAPLRAVAILLAIVSVFSTFRPIIMALAPRCTIALTCALQMVPAPGGVSNDGFQCHISDSNYDDAVTRERTVLTSGTENDLIVENAIFPDRGHILGLRNSCHIDFEGAIQLEECKDR